MDFRLLLERRRPWYAFSRSSTDAGLFESPATGAGNMRHGQQSVSCPISLMIPSQIEPLTRMVRGYVDARVYIPFPSGLRRLRYSNLKHRFGQLTHYSYSSCPNPFLQSCRNRLMPNKTCGIPRIKCLSIGRCPQDHNRMGCGIK